MAKGGAHGGERWREGAEQFVRVRVVGGSEGDGSPGDKSLVDGGVWGGWLVGRVVGRAGGGGEVWLVYGG